jgi:hypothetical protein
MNRSSYLLVGLVVLAVLSQARQARAGGRVAIERTDHGARVLIDGELFTEYLVDTGAKPILWPIRGPGGVEMTRAYPMREAAGEKQDHIHQRSFWFTHGSVNGVDFWSEQGEHGSIAHRDFESLTATDDCAVLVTRNDWLGPHGKRICDDRRMLTFHMHGETRVIDFDITIYASDGAVTFGDTKEGSFGIRVPTVLDVDNELGGRIVTSEGQADEAAWGKPARWVDYHGPLAGDTMGIAILNHPTSFRYPTHWHVRTYGLFAANPFGLHDFEGGEDGRGAHTIDSGDSISLRYRVLFHRGNEKQADIESEFSTYSKQ